MNLDLYVIPFNNLISYFPGPMFRSVGRKVTFSLSFIEIASVINFIYRFYNSSGKLREY